MDSPSVSEELAALSADELLAASQETSTAYNGIVLSEMIRIVLLRCRLTATQLRERLDISRKTYYSIANGHPIGDRAFRNYLERLTFIVHG